MSFNDRVSQINKTDKSNNDINNNGNNNSNNNDNNNNMPASRNHSLFETTVEEKINALDNTSGNNANFPNCLMSVKNIYNFDAHPWPKNMILIAGDSMIYGMNEKHISINFKSVKIRCFSGATIGDMYFNLPTVGKKPAALVLHMGTNNSSNETLFQIYDKLLNLVHFIKENNSNCHVVLSSPINRLDYGKNPHLTLLIIAILDIVFLVCMDCI